MGNTCRNSYPTRRLLGDSTTTSFKISDSPKTFSSSALKADAIRATMVQNTQNASLGLLVEGEADSASTSALTPTTTKILTDLFQSENCIDKPDYRKRRFCSAFATSGCTNSYCFKQGNEWQPQKLYQTRQQILARWYYDCSNSHSF